MMVTVQMIADHCGLSLQTIRARLKQDGVEIDNLGGRAGWRIKLGKANTFIRRRYPQVIMEKGEMSFSKH